MNFDIEQAGKAVFSSTGIFASLSAKPKHFVVTFPSASLNAQLIPGNLFLMVSKLFMVFNPLFILNQGDYNTKKLIVDNVCMLTPIIIILLIIEKCDVKKTDLKRV